LKAGKLEGLKLKNLLSALSYELKNSRAHAPAFVFAHELMNLRAHFPTSPLPNRLPSDLIFLSSSILWPLFADTLYETTSHTERSEIPEVRI